MIRRLVPVFALALALVLSVSRLQAVEKLGLTDAEKALRTYLEAEKGSTDCKPATIVAFDHRLQTWSVLSWGEDGLIKKLGPVEKPELALRGAERVRAFVIDTNPLIFTADRSATAEANIESLATLQQLAQALAGVVTKGLQVKGTANAFAKLASKNAAVDEIHAFNVGGRVPTSTDLQLWISSKPSLTATPKAAILTYTTAYLAALDAIDIPLSKLDPLKASAKVLEGTLKRVQEDALLGWLQAIESGVDSVPAPLRVELATVSTQFRDLKAGREQAAAIEVPCADSIGRLAEVVLVKRTPLLGSDSVARLDAYTRAATKIDEGMGEQGCSADLSTATTQLKIWLLQNPPTAMGPTDPDEIAALKSLSDSIWSYLEIARKVEEATSKAKVLAESEPKIIASVSRINRFLDRAAILSDHGISGIQGVVEVQRSAFVGESLHWTKARTDTVEVALDESLAGKLTLHHPTKVSGSFVAERKLADGLGVDFAVIHTDIFSPTFVAKDDDGQDGGSATIVETDRSTRSGKVALMAAYRFPLGAGFGIGPSLGAGLDTGDAAFFAGVSVNWRFVVLGFGETWQKVTALNGQSVGDTLPEGQTLKTKDRFERDQYLSLALSIRDLPFFKPKESK